VIYGWLPQDRAWPAPALWSSGREPAMARREVRARRLPSRAPRGALRTVGACLLAMGSVLAQQVPAAATGAHTAGLCEKAGGRMLRASTFTMKLSQTCLCGAQVRKTLADRVHRCRVCGLVADRDMVSGALAAHVRLTDPDDPSTAGLDTVQARTTQILFAQGLQEALSSQPQRGARPPQGPHPRGSPPSGNPRTAGLCSAKHHPTRTCPPTPNETQPANKRHKAHVGTAVPVGNAPPSGVTPEQELVGRHPITG
jgi:hypothetical protein